MWSLSPWTAALRLLVGLALMCGAEGDRLISTVLHRDRVVTANKPAKLDIEVLDSFGDVVPWGDLLKVHQRKMHVYAIHQVWLHHSHACPIHCMHHELQETSSYY